MIAEFEADAGEGVIADDDAGGIDGCEGEIGPSATRANAAARSATKMKRGAILLARKTSCTVGSTSQKISLPPTRLAAR